MKRLLLLAALLFPLTGMAQVASVTVDANGNVLNGKIINFATGKLEVNGVQITGLETDASTSAKGVVKLSTAPASPSNPIAVGDNDPRNTNARTPTAHAGTHASAGSDPVTLIIAQITGLQGALDLKAPLASPTFTGVPLAPTAAVDTNTTQIATTGFVLAQAGSATPIVASTGAVGTSTRYARQDHVHPAQTSVTGNAGTATALQTARTINGTSFDGTGNITVAAAAGTLTGATLAAGVTGSSLTSAAGGSFGTAAYTNSTAYATSSQGVITLTLNTPSLIYTNPITFTNTSGAWAGTLTPIAQAANTVFGNFTGSSATPTFSASPTFNGANITALTAANITNSTTVGRNTLNLTNPSAITFLKIAADNSVSTESASTHRTSLGATTAGGNLFTLTNPSAVTFLQVNADNTVTAQSASAQRTALSLVASATTDTTNAANISSGTLPAGRMPALTGDVTTSAGAVATTIATNAVTNAKAAQMAANTVKGNNTGSTANAADLTVSQTQTLLQINSSNKQTTTLGSAASTITFTVPSGYTNLKLIFQGRSSAAANTPGVNLTFNSDSGANYSYTWLYYAAGTGGSDTGSATSARVGSIPGTTTTANYPGTFHLSIPNYAGTTFYKAFDSYGGDDTGASVGETWTFHGTWANTAAITSLTLTAASGNFVTGTVATLIAE